MGKGHGPKSVWLNGRLRNAEEAAVPIGDFGLLYGEGLFETMRAEAYRIAYLGRHLDRLRRGGDALKLWLPPDLELRRGLSELLEETGEKSLRLRLTVTRGSAGSFVSPDDVPSTVFITAQPAPPVPARWSGIWAAGRRNEKDPLCEWKTTSILGDVMEKRRAWAYGADESILLNSRGQLAEGAMSNLFVWNKGVLLTPPRDAGILPGIIRSVILDRGRASGMPVEERSVSPDELRYAESAFMTNAVVGAALLIALEGEPIGNLYRNSIASRVQGLLWRPEDWIAP